MRRHFWPTGAPAPYLPCGPGSQPFPVAAMPRIINRLSVRFARWLYYRQTVRELSRMDARTLKDIGLPGGYGSIYATAKMLAAEAVANDNQHDRAA